MTFEDHRFCVYIHRRKDNNQIFYVGQGTLDRPKCRSRKLKLWNEVVKSAGGFTYEIVEQNLSKDRALELENILIEFIGKQLTNNCKNSSEVSELNFLDFNDRYYVCDTSPSGLRYKKDIYADRPTIGDKILCHKINTCVGSQSSSGWQISWNRRSYRVHRVIWMLIHGKVNRHMVIDHIDGNCFNNRIENLREVTHSENCRNRKVDKRSTSGIAGLSFARNRTRMRISVTVDNNIRLTKSVKIEDRGYDSSLSFLLNWRKDRLIEHGIHDYSDRHLAINIQE